MTGIAGLRSARLGVFLALLIVLVPLTVYVWGRNSSAFAVERIRITGARRVAAASAAATLRAQFLGENLFTVRSDDVAAALRPFPYFADVEIDRDFPTTLRVHIVEYRPAAVLFSSGRWYVISREGRVLLRLPGKVSRPQPADAGAQAGAQATAADGPAAAGAGGGSGGGNDATGEAKAGALNAAAATADTPAPSGGGSAGGEQAAAAASSAEASGTAADTAAGAGADAAAAQVVAEISAESLAAPAHVPSLFDGDLTAQTLATVALPRLTRRLPVVLTEEKVKVGDTVDDRYARDALAVLAALPRALRAHVRFVTSSPSGIDVVMRSGVTFAFGDGRDLTNKSRALRAVLAAYRRRHLRATWVDVSVPNRPLGTPVIVSRPAPLQSARPTPKPKTTGTKASPTPTSRSSAKPTASASPAPRPTSSPTPKPSGSARPAASPSPTATKR